MLTNMGSLLWVELPESVIRALSVIAGSGFRLRGFGRISRHNIFHPTASRSFLCRGLSSSRYESESSGNPVYLSTVEEPPAQFPGGRGPDTPRVGGRTVLNYGSLRSQYGQKAPHQGFLELSFNGVGKWLQRESPAPSYGFQCQP